MTNLHNQRPPNTRLCSGSLPSRQQSRYPKWMQASRRDELNQFKSEIHIGEFATTYGFEIDRKKSSRASLVMRHPNGDKLIISRNANRQWMYFNVHDDRDQGTIIDFVQLRENCSLGEVRKLLRTWLGRSESHAIARQETALPDLDCVEPDFTKVMSTWVAAMPVKRHPYLEQRYISPAVLTDEIFADRMRIDHRGNALFPHFASEQITGIEIKNQGFTGFSPGGKKGLWSSLPRETDQELWIFETVVDALSAATLFGTQGKRFVSTAGQVSQLQLALLHTAAQVLPAEGCVVLAMDNDAAGRKLVASLTPTFESLDFNVVQRLPENEGDDWNDVLTRSKQTALSPAWQLAIS